MIVSAIITVSSAEASFTGKEIGDKFSAELIQEGAVPQCLMSSCVKESEEVSITQIIVNGLQNAEEEINIIGAQLTFEQVEYLYQDIMNSHPELFYVGFEYRCFSDENGFIKAIYPTYTMELEEVEKRKIEYYCELEKIVSLTRDISSDLEKIVFVHDYLCANYSYDKTESIFDAYSFFTTKTGVCQAYTLAFIAIMNELGINVGYVASDSMNHIWNKVELDSKWYHIDITWDDTYKQSVCGQVKHTNLLLSDYGIQSTGHTDWNSNIDVLCSDGKYDVHFWNDINHPFVWLDDNVLCIADGTCFSVNLASGSLIYFGIDTEWMYSGLDTYNGKLLCSFKNCIKVYDDAGVYQYDIYSSAKGENIYGFNAYDKVLSIAQANKFSSDLSMDISKQLLVENMFSVDLSPVIYNDDTFEKEIKSSLVRDDSYTVSYTFDETMGKAEIEITGINDYCGKLNLTFLLCDEYGFFDSVEELEKYKNIDTDDKKYSLISYSGYEKIYGTGSVLQIYSNENNELINSYILVIEGDVNGDGFVDVLDTTQAALVTNGHKTLDGAYERAADSNYDDIIDINDYQDIVNKAVS